VFFFQAEDGIRDRNVTGVQTCALSISVCLRQAHSPSRYVFYGERGRAKPGRPDDSSRFNGLRILSIPVHTNQRKARARHAMRFRSEERRVGKREEVRAAR